MKKIVRLYVVIQKTVEKNLYFNDNTLLPDIVLFCMTASDKLTV